MANSGLCARPSCARFTNRDCGYDCKPGTHCTGYVWSGRLAREAEESEKVSKSKRDDEVEGYR